MQSYNLRYSKPHPHPSPQMSSRDPFYFLPSGPVHCLSHWQFKGNTATEFVCSPLPTSPLPWLAPWPWPHCRLARKYLGSQHPRLRTSTIKSTFTFIPSQMLLTFPLLFYSWFCHSLHIETLPVVWYLRKWNTLFLCLRGDSLRLQPLTATRDLSTALINLVLNALGECCLLTMNLPLHFLNF